LDYLFNSWTTAWPISSGDEVTTSYARKARLSAGAVLRSPFGTGLVRRTFFRIGEINMALIECPDCDKQISESAIGCPHCGLMLTREIIASQKEAKAKREQGAAEIARREERKLVIWMTAIAVLTVAVAVLCVVRPSQPYTPHWSDGVSDTTNAKQSPWLRGYSDREKESILQEAYLFDAAAQQLERDRDR
jgi:hypothetical protein